MLLVFLAGALAAVSTACAVMICVHAFRRSVGTGVMVIGIPGYLAVYAFTQFEHRFKPLIATTYVACLMLSAVFSALGYQVYVGVPPLHT
jgi:hypothetical protein